MPSHPKVRAVIDAAARVARPMRHPMLHMPVGVPREHDQGAMRGLNIHKPFPFAGHSLKPGSHPARSSRSTLTERHQALHLVLAPSDVPAGEFARSRQVTCGQYADKDCL